MYSAAFSILDVNNGEHSYSPCPTHNQPPLPAAMVEKMERLFGKKGGEGWRCPASIEGQRGSTPRIAADKTISTKRECEAGSFTSVNYRVFERILEEMRRTNLLFQMLVFDKP
ncbi:hypothetical protein H2248_000621 [Termitomyces sp. 'cryptogamus']|nr:hypothetical protein H2248_000621 [Termitomyces sp. 'cryptogamus']